jgi:hypothetical protein
MNPIDAGFAEDERNYNFETLHVATQVADDPMHMALPAQNSDRCVDNLQCNASGRKRHTSSSAWSRTSVKSEKLCQQECQWRIGTEACVEVLTDNTEVGNFDEIDTWCNKILGVANNAVADVEDDDVTTSGAVCATSDFDGVTKGPKELSEDKCGSNHSEALHEAAQVADDHADVPLPSTLSLPLFEGSKHSLGSAVLRVQTFFLKKNLTTSTVQETLDLLHDLLPDDNILPRTRFRLDRAIGGKLSTKCTIFCLSCNNEVENLAVEKCPSCEKEIRNSTGRFWSIDPRKQLQCAMEDRHMLSRVTFPADQQSAEDKLSWSNCEAYNAFKSRINITERSDLSYTIGIDGFPLYRTSPCELCPVYISINEIPERQKPSFIVTCGLWSGKKSLKSAAFLPIVVKHLQALQVDGVRIKICDEGNFTYKTVRFHPTMCIMDAPQRAETLGLCRFNSIYGCDKCYIQSQSIQKKAGYTRKFSMSNSQAETSIQRASDKGCVHAEKRTMSDTLMLQHTKAPKVANNLGVKVVSPLAKLTNFDYIEDSPPCYLHQVCLGQVRWIMTQLFSVRGSKPEPTADCPNLHGKVAAVDSAVNDIYVPACMQRLPRSLLEMGYFRGHEYESWMIIIAPMVLADFLPEDHYNHLVLLSSAMFWLTLDGAPITEVQRCERTLRVFGRHLEHLYCPSALTYNAHMVSEHMATTAVRFGPLRVASAGIFEANHFRLKSALHGKKLADVEVCRIMRQRIGCIRLASALEKGGLLPTECSSSPTRSLGPYELGISASTNGGYESVTTNNGQKFTVFHGRPAKGGTMSCFVGVLLDRGNEETTEDSNEADDSDEDNDDKRGYCIAFGRIESIYAQESTVFLRLLTVPTVVCPRNRQPMRLLTGRTEGCSYSHIARLAADPFGDLEYWSDFTPDSVLGACAVSSSHIGVMPAVQGWNAP